MMFRSHNLIILITGCISLLVNGHSCAGRECIATRRMGAPASEFEPPEPGELDAGQQQQVEPVWEYEPRVWTPDEPDEEIEELGEILRENRHQQQQSQFASSRATANEKSAAGEVKRANNSEATFYGSQAEPYFWDARRRHYGKLEVSSRQQSGAPAQKCTQFRADIRETVICDKRRCDKLDFEWPRHSNQLVLMETTKHGMRFHRSEFAFNSAQLRQEIPTNSSASRISPPVKFDLFELFKPKPTNSPAPALSSPAYASSRTSVAPTTPQSTTAATSEPEPESAKTPETTTAAPETAPPDQQATSTEPTDNGAGDGGGAGQTTSSSRDQSSISAQDNNQTKLVTTFRLNTGRRMQRLIGFGGALSDSTCRNIKSLSAAMARSLMEDYFGARGLRYNIVRMTMGSSDFSASPYTNNDQQPPAPASVAVGGGGGGDGDEPAKDDDWARRRKAPLKRAQRLEAATQEERDDFEMNNFRLTDEDHEFKLPVARQAIATSKRPLKFYSSLWSPPIWMKNNSNIVHGRLKGDVYGPYYKALAELMVKWLEAYRRQGIEFWASTGLNEPVTGSKPFIFHNSLEIARDDYVTFIKLHLGPMLRRRGFRDLKLIALDDNKGYAPTWAKALLADAEAAKFVAGIGVHWYMNDEYENLNFLARNHPDKFLLSTEACNGYLPFQVHTLPGNWDRGLAYMLDIIKLMHKNVAGWVDWNMALDLAGGPSWIKNYLDAAVIVNAERDEYYKSPMFYAVGHFSRFVEPDSFRLDHRLAYAKYDYPLEAVGYLTPKSQIVIVALNANKHPVPFRIIVDRQVIKVVDLKADSFSTIIFNWNSKRNTQ